MTDSAAHTSFERGDQIRLAVPVSIVVGLAEWGVLGLIGLSRLFVGSLLLSTRKSPGYQIAIWTFWIMATIDIAWSIPQLTCLWWPLLGLSTRPSNSETHV